MVTVGGWNQNKTAETAVVVTHKIINIWKINYCIIERGTVIVGLYHYYTSEYWWGKLHHNLSALICFVTLTSKHVYSVFWNQLLEKRSLGE